MAFTIGNLGKESLPEVLYSHLTDGTPFPDIVAEPETQKISVPIMRKVPIATLEGSVEKGTAPQIGIVGGTIALPKTDTTIPISTMTTAMTIYDYKMGGFIISGSGNSILTTE